MEEAMRINLEEVLWRGQQVYWDWGEGSRRIGLNVQMEDG